MAITYHLLNTFNGESLLISQYFWEIIRPQSVRDTNDVTNFLNGVIKHPITGEEALIVDTESEFFQLEIHPEVTEENINSRTQLIEDLGIINTEEKEMIRSNLLLAKSTRQQITLLELLPEKYKIQPSVKSHQEMIADGWFIVEEI